MAYIKRKPGDIIAEKYILLELVGKDKNGYLLGKFNCPYCNNIFTSRVADVSKGHTKTCGCLQSKAEQKINEILSSLNIPFEAQKTFPTCKINNNLLKFDYYLPQENLLIEYDGIQHFSYSGRGWDTKEKFIKTQKYDKFKNQWCKENNILLIRIPYTDFELLSANYLLNKIKENV